MFVYVGGIPGVGKTTIINTTVSLARLSNFPIINLDEKGILCQITGAATQEDYTKLSHKIRVMARRKLVEYLYSIDATEPGIIQIRDDHFTAPTDGGIYWTRPLDSRDRDHMLAFVVIIAKPEVIIQRRLARNFLYPEPGFFKFNTIVQHQEMEIQIAYIQSEQLQIPVRFIESEEGKLKETSILLLKFLQEIVKKRG